MKNNKYQGFVETLYNPGFKPIEFDRFKNETVLNALTLWPQILQNVESYKYLK